MRKLLFTTAAVALMAGASSLAFAQTTYDPTVTPVAPLPPAAMEMTYQQPAPIAPTLPAPAPVITTTEQTMIAPPAPVTTTVATETLPSRRGAEFGTSSHDYPRGWGVEWQQSYQLGARPEISGSTTVSINDVTSQGRYDRLVRQPITTEFPPASGSSMPPTTTIYGR